MERLNLLQVRSGLGQGMVRVWVIYSKFVEPARRGGAVRGAREPAAGALEAGSGHWTC